MHRSRCHESTLYRRGVSILEVLAVVATLAILMGLLLPAVQSSREAGRKIHCRNQLRQISLGFQNYESTYNTFPGRSFHRQIRPFVEVPKDSVEVPLYACPSDRDNATGDSSLGKTSFAINAGLHSFRPQEFGVVYDASSAPQRHRRTADFADGLSNTAMVAEKLSFPWFAPKSVLWKDVPQYANRTYLYFEGQARSPDEFAASCRTAESPIGTWIMGEVYHHLMPPNSRSCVAVDDDGTLAGEYSQGRMAASLHPGGTHLARADGSVEFVSSSIDLTVWRAIGTRSGGDAF